MMDRANTDSVIKKSEMGGSDGGGSNTSAGKDYKADFKKEGTLCPSDFGSCCKG